MCQNLDFLLLPLLFLLLTGVRASVDLCSSKNTGSTSASVSIYQSNGLCEQTCQGYAYAILLNKSCWCSDYTPSDTTDVSDCSDNCPGYSQDQCGNVKKGLYAYLLLSTPSGTQEESSGSSSSTTKATSSSTSGSTTTSTSSSASISSSGSTSSLTSISTSSSTTLSSTSRSASASSPSPTSSPRFGSSSSSSTMWITSYISTTTNADGVVSTKYITTQPTSTFTVSPTSSPSSASSSNSKSGFLNNKGAVAGVFTVVAIVVVCMIAALVFFLLHRNKKKQRNLQSESGPLPPDQNQNGSHKQLASDVTGGSSLIHFMQTPVDQRLDPKKIFMNLDDNNSRGSLQDEYDYTRKVLQVTNPDADLESNTDNDDCRPSFTTSRGNARP